MKDLGEGFGGKPWTEAGLQRMLALKFNKSGCMCVPNCGVFGWEADLIRVNPKLFASEYEIKITRADFRADAGKTWKHLRLSEATEYVNMPPPNFFWYVAPSGVVPLDEVPRHAGLLEIVGHDIVPTKRAPRLHREPLKPKDLMDLARGAALRYWGKRYSEAV